jgi:molecular chaperone GrpE
MADETRDPDEATGEDAVAIDLDDDQGGEDLESAMRDAVAAVEEVESHRGGDRGDRDGRAGVDQEVEKLRREIADLRDRSMRTLADFDNFRKRAERERQEIRRYAAAEPVQEFLGVMDNLGLALAASGSADDLKRGVEMIHRQMQDLLRRLDVTEVPALGEKFDPAVHEAVSSEESPEVQAPTVVGEMRRGYKLHDRLLRPSMVRVAVPPEARGGGGEDGGA